MGLTGSVALLRGVNVGGHGKLKMEALRDIGRAAGLLAVSTHLASGNLVFASPDPDRDIAERLTAAFEVSLGAAPVFHLRSARMLAALAARCPFPGADPARIGLLFLHHPPAGIAPTGCTDEQIVPDQREIWIHYPSGMGRSRLSLPQIKSGTMRNLNTVRALAEKAATARASAQE